MGRALRIRLVGIAAIVTVAGVSCGQSGPPRRAGPAPQTTVPTTTIPTTTITTTVPRSTTTAPRPTTTVAPPPGPTVPAAAATLITKGRTSAKVVALTFDAGSDAGRTADILRILADNHIHATFGLTGLWAQSNPALVKQIAAAGNQIVNHSWDHKSFTGYSSKTAPLTAAQITRELVETETLLRTLTGAGTHGWFRPPYGDRSTTVDQVAGAAGYRYDLMWTIDTLGWKGVSTDTVVQRSLGALAPGEIILMHVGSASTDAAALPALITALKARGYSFVSVASMV